MVKNRKSYTIFTTVVCLLPVAVGLILQTRLPDQIVSHFSVDGTVNGLASKSSMAFLKKTLSDMDQAVINLKAGSVSPVINLPDSD